MEESLNWVSEIIAEYAPKLALSVATLIIGFIVIGWVIRIFKKTLVRANIEISLQNFLSSLVSILLKILLIFSVASTFGIVTTSFVAILGAAAFAIGMALQGSLSHFASGVLILIFKPYRVGDFVEIAGKSGTVKEIQVFHTILTTLNNNMIIVPNGSILSDPITNFTSLGVRRFNIIFGIGYDDDIDQAKEIIIRLFKGHDLVLKEEPIEVMVESHGDSSVNLAARAWAKSEDYWGIYFYMMENVKKEFDKAGVGIPFPQMDVHFPDKVEQN
ncbi:mechanosensitive ion channel family protein [Membranihabitans maritimus]|uniref:mechanosensitive ion channel family protein n=1 Tax=Membranihabitans maritimus TaxID=2904244 RepID=UPI001F031C02|nr:mechanosensitive ion channel domain-containing protein [Membranihabitans maritimus]